MKKQLFFALVALVIAIEAKPQNVGIGTTSPREKLDVNGNVNISGTIKTNGFTGQPGHVLASTGNGLSWTSLGSLMNYKHCTMFFSNSSFIVPDGVKEVMVEAWGGGGGGYWTTAYENDVTTIYINVSVGGSSGSYARTIQPVAPGQTLTIEIGIGGLSANNFNTSGDGGKTKVTFPKGAYLVAVGGGGAKGEMYRSGLNYRSFKILQTQNEIDASMNNTSPEIAKDAFFINGNFGKPGSERMRYLPADEYLQTDLYGNGAAPVGMINSSETFGGYITYENGVSDYATQKANQANIPSAGGGGYDGDGAGGLVIIWWN